MGWNLEITVFTIIPSTKNDLKQGSHIILQIPPKPQVPGAILFCISLYYLGHFNSYSFGMLLSWFDDIVFILKI
jgi:hypothetical protein